MLLIVTGPPLVLLKVTGLASLLTPISGPGNVSDEGARLAGVVTPVPVRLVIWGCSRRRLELRVWRSGSRWRGGVRVPWFWYSRLGGGLCGGFLFVRRSR